MGRLRGCGTVVVQFVDQMSQRLYACYAIPRDRARPLQVRADESAATTTRSPPARTTGRDAAVAHRHATGLVPAGVRGPRPQWSQSRALWPGPHGRWESAQADFVFLLPR